MINPIPVDKLPQSVMKLAEAFEPYEDSEPEETLEFPLSQWYWRSVAAVCLSHRLKARQEGGANKTDANRFGKEANFNQTYLSSYPEILEDAGILVSDWRTGIYSPGPCFDVFWCYDPSKMRQVILDGVRKGLRKRVGVSCGETETMWTSGLAEFFALFHIAFSSARRAPKWDDLADALRRFAELPVDDLLELGRLAGLDPASLPCDQWGKWLGGKRHALMVEVIGLRRWWIGLGDSRNPLIVLSSEAQAVFGIIPWEQCELPPARELVSVQSDRSVFAGINAPASVLATMIKYSKVRILGDVCEMTLDPKMIKEGVNAAEELKDALFGIKDLPHTVSNLIFSPQSAAPSASVKYQYCSMIIKTSAADAIARHSKLKNYISRKLEADYLLIKYDSNPENFLKRCIECGFNVEPL